MKVLARSLADVRNKYVIGIDPDRVHIDVDLKEVAPMLDFAAEGDTQQ